MWGHGARPCPRLLSLPWHSTARAGWHWQRTRQMESERQNSQCSVPFLSLLLLLFLLATAGRSCVLQDTCVCPLLDQSVTLSPCQLGASHLLAYFWAERSPGMWPGCLQGLCLGQSAGLCCHTEPWPSPCPLPRVWGHEDLGQCHLQSCWRRGEELEVLLMECKCCSHPEFPKLVVCAALLRLPLLLSCETKTAPGTVGFPPFSHPGRDLSVHCA